MHRALLGCAQVWPLRHVRGVAPKYGAAAVGAFSFQAQAGAPCKYASKRCSQPSCCLQSALLSEFLAELLQISSLTCALPVGSSTSAQVLPQPHSSGQGASAVQQRSPQAALPEVPQQQGDAAPQDSIMLGAATEALLRAVSGQCRVQAGCSNR